MSGLVENGALIALRPEVELNVRLYWHQWRLGPDGTPPSERVALLDRIGDALVAGAKAALGPPSRAQRS